jgi:DNA primase
MNDIFSFIRNTVDIVDVISRYITLKQSGNYLKGLSPFKYEKTASFVVTPQKKMFYCFSTNCGGDVIDFVSRLENCTQGEALQKIIDWYNIQYQKT